MKKTTLAIEFMQNMFGYLPSHIKSGLYEYLEFPTNDNWNEIYGMVISQRKLGTVWQAVLEIDPTFPKSIPQSAYHDDNVLWSMIPTPEQLIQALNKVAFQEMYQHRKN